MFSDTHCHLCPGLDDGPRDLDEALAMCHLAWNEGIRIAAVTGHQNHRWPLTPEQIISAADQLAAELRQLGCDMQLVPVGEVMVSENTLDDWQAGKLLSVGNERRYIMLEFPHNLFLDIRPLISEFAGCGVRVVLAHAERYPELLHGGSLVDDWIRAGCVIQINSDSIGMPAGRHDAAALRSWARRGVIHVIGSDAHSPRHRVPTMQAAYQRLARWIGPEPARSICWDNGHAVLTGAALELPIPQSAGRKWF